MRKTSATPEAGAPASRRYYRWDAAPGGPSILLDSRMAQRIHEQVMEGFHALPKRGMEVGGILLGQVVQREPLEIRIDEVEPIACEHRFGPSFTLSPQDRQQLEAMLEKHRANRRLAVIGYYRSCTGRDLALDSNDEELIQAYFAAEDQICLGVAPISAQQCAAALFSWVDGRIPMEPATRSFRLHVEEEPAVEVEPELPAPATRAVPAEPEAPAPPLPPPPPVSAPPASRDQRILPWLLVLVMAAGCAFLYERWQSASHDWSAPLGLSVEHTSTGLEVTWDASSPVVQKAARGLVTITENSEERRMELDAAAVKRATMSLTTAADNVLIRLTVYGPEMQSAAESFRIVAAEHLAPEAASSATAKPNPVEPPQPAAAVPPPSETVDVPAAPPEPEKPVSAPARAAQPVYQVQPGIPEGIRARISGSIVVPVEVEISAAGRVSNAAPQGDGDPLYRYLAERATVAARAWRFEPARSRNGKAVRSSKTLYFVFKS